MANLKVELMRLCKTEDGKWRRYPALIGKTGKVKPGFVKVDGEPREYPLGHYELRMYRGSKVVYVNVGDDATEALAKRDREAILLVGRQAAASAGTTIVEPVVGRIDLEKKRVAFLARLEDQGKAKAVRNCGYSIAEFLKITKHRYADELTEDSLLTFYRELRKKKNSDRTIYNKHSDVFNFFRWLGIDTKKLADRPPAYTKREVTVYRQDEISSLLGSSEGYLHVLVLVFLRLGLRMQEAIHLNWMNVDFKARRVRIRERTEDGVTIKDRAERSVPMDDLTIETLQDWRTKNPSTNLVLGTENDTPNWKMREALKRLVKRSGLNCGRCKGCKGPTGWCSHWTLKKFRATYTTRMLKKFDVRVVMTWTGHEDLETVMKYLAPHDERDEVREQLNAVPW